MYVFRSLAEACSDGDVGTVRKLLTEGRSVHETTEEGESLLSLACSAGYYELAQVYIIWFQIYLLFYYKINFLIILGHCKAINKVNLSYYTQKIKSNLCTI